MLQPTQNLHSTKYQQECCGPFLKWEAEGSFITGKWEFHYGKPIVSLRETYSLRMLNLWFTET